MPLIYIAEVIFLSNIVSTANNSVQDERFWTIYQKYASLLNAYGRKKMLCFPHLLGDALQEIWIGICPYLDRLSAMTEEGAQAYLFSAFDHAAAKLLKKEPSVQDNIVSFDELGENALPDHTDLLDEICASDSFQRIVNTILSLPKQDRDVLYFHLVEHMTFQEIAQFLNLPRDTVYKRFRRANKRLRQKLRKEGGDFVYEGK